jgi:hypothetical protein
MKKLEFNTLVMLKIYINTTRYTYPFVFHGHKSLLLYDNNMIMYLMEDAHVMDLNIL